MPQGSICVLDPAPYLEVTLEDDESQDVDVHIHPAGQGFWVARMAARLGADVMLVAPFGGEVGIVLPPLIEHEGVRTVRVRCEQSNGAAVSRADVDDALVEVRHPRLSRHERDDLQGAAFSSALTSDVFVLAGARSPAATSGMYERLARDLRANAVTVLADLSGEALQAALAGGVDLLKVSDEQLRHDGYLSGDGPDEARSAIATLKQQGAAQVVLSRGGQPCLVDLDGQAAELRGPDVVPVDPHGGGDSMTGALATAFARGDAPDAALRLAMAAATAGVLRHGLASAQRADIERLAEQITLTPERHRS